MTSSPDLLFEILQNSNNFSLEDQLKASHDKALYNINIEDGIDTSLLKLKSTFNNKAIIEKLKLDIKSQATKSLRYGGVVEWIKNNTTTVPTPMSWEIKKEQILGEKYVVIHPVTTWGTRTWPAINWMNLTAKLIEMGYSVVSVGKDSSEWGFFNVDKPVFNFEIEKGLNLMNKTSISDTWHIISNAHAFVTMDSGLLHLAGTTDTNIVHLGSSLIPEFRIPFRKGTQDYKYSYVRGGCDLECGSNMKYGVKEWGDIQGVPPLIKCLENKKTFECHPSVEQVLNQINNVS